MTRLRAPSVNEQNELEDTEQSGAFTRGAPHVLVVEDHVEIARVLRECLAERGCTVRVAYDGQTALELARMAVPDVVLLDIGLPGMSGYEVARRLRADPLHARCRIIALTGYVGSAERAHALRAGCDHYVAKPPDPETLVALVRRSRRRRTAGPA